VVNSELNQMEGRLLQKVRKTAYVISKFPMRNIGRGLDATTLWVWTLIESHVTA